MSRSCRHRISYRFEKDEDEERERLSVYIGSAHQTEYRLSIDPKDIYLAEHRHDALHKEYYLKLRLLAPCTLSKLPISAQDHSYKLLFDGNVCSKRWVNHRGKIHRECGNELIYDDSQIDWNRKEAVYHRHHGHDHEDEIETSLDMLPKLIGKALILFFVFSGDCTDSEPQRLKEWLSVWTRSKRLIPPAAITSIASMVYKNEYRANLLPLRGGDIVAEPVIDAVDVLVNQGRIANEAVLHEEEMNQKWLEMLSDSKYRTRFIGRGQENVDQAVIRCALQYYGCHTVNGLKRKLIANGIAKMTADETLRFLVHDTRRRILDEDGANLLITAPLSNRNSIEMKRCLVTPSRIILCPPEHWPLGDVLGWMVDHKYQDHLLLVSLVMDIDKGSNTDLILKQYVLNGMEDGHITVCNRKYQFLMATPWMWRHRTLCFFQSSQYLNGKHVRTQQLLSRVCRPQLTSNGVMTHWATQRMMPSMLSIKGSDIEFEIDGDADCGLMPAMWANHELYKQLVLQNAIKLSLYRLDVDEYKEGECPTLIRFAYKGFFGVLQKNKNPKTDKFVFGRKQKKYRFHSSENMEIYAFSDWKPMYLRPNIMFVLQALGVDVQGIYKVIRDRLKLLNYARFDDAAAKRLLSSMDSLDIPSISGTHTASKRGYSWNDSVWIKALNLKLLSESDAFLRKMVHILVENQVRDLRSEHKVMLEYKDGALLFGCLDQFGILKKNQVFIQTFDREQNRWDRWKKQRILILSENHCYYPGDALLMEIAVILSDEMAAIYKNVVVFPQGMSERLFRCGGSTLNGEGRFVCIRNEALIPNRNHFDFDWIEYPKPSQMKQPRNENMTEYAYSTLLNAERTVDYGELEYLWMSHADLSGAASNECRAISAEIYRAKKYHLLQTQTEDIQQFECPLIPPWIRSETAKKKKRKKRRINTESRSIMVYVQEIVDRKCREYRLSMPSDVGYGMDVDVDAVLMEELSQRGRPESAWNALFADDAFIEHLTKTKRAFEFDLFVRCKQIGVVNECELINYKMLDLELYDTASMDWSEYNLLRLRRSHFLCGRERAFSMKVVLSKMSHDFLRNYRMKLLQGFEHNLYADSLYAKAVYIYDLIYRHNRDSLLFAWILADYWLAVKATAKHRKCPIPRAQTLWRPTHKKDVLRSPGYFDAPIPSMDPLDEHRFDDDDDGQHIDGEDDECDEQQTVCINNYDDVERFYKNQIEEEYKEENHTNYEHLESLRYIPLNSNQKMKNEQNGQKRYYHRNKVRYSAVSPHLME